MARPITSEMEVARNDPQREPILIYILQTPQGGRMFTESRVPDEWAQGERAVFDSTVKFSGSTIYGGTTSPWLDQQARLLDIGSIRSDQVRNTSDILESLAGRTSTRDTFTVELSNADGYFRDIIGEEPFLASSGSIVLGFKGLDFREHLEVAPKTRIDEVGWRGTILRLKHRR